MHDLLASALKIEIHNACLQVKSRLPDLDDDHTMTETDKQNLLDILLDFVHQAIPKYINGKVEHGGNLATMGQRELRRNLEAEIIDAWVYTQNLK